MAVGLWVWVGFTGLILALLLVDLLIFHRRAHEVTVKESLGWTAVWIAISVAFGAGVWIWLGATKGLEYYTGYVIEKSLSVDNLFVFLLIFNYFGVPKRDEHKVLFWGILGALAFRLLFILAGVSLIERFNWIIYFFGALLIVAAIRMVVRQEEEVHPDRNPFLRLFRRFVPTASGYTQDKFLLKQAGRWVATPLLLVLVVVETTDIVFALDSIPAIFAITLDPFIVFTSNAFAILGLRALYFALEASLARLRYLHYGLGALLGFVGVKILASYFVHLPLAVTFGVTGGILLVTIVGSLVVRNGGPGAEVKPPRESEPKVKDERLPTQTELPPDSQQDNKT